VTSPDEIADLMPAAGARVLITSRFSDWSGLAEEISLDVMLPEEALDFIQRRAKRDDPPGAKALAESLGFLPLALDHAAAYCKRRQMGFTDYADQAASLIAHLPRGVGYPLSVAATFDLAIGEAASQCSIAEAIMAYVALCAPERIPILLLDGATEQEELRSEALSVLAEVSLIIWGGSYRGIAQRLIPYIPYPKSAMMLISEIQRGLVLSGFEWYGDISLTQSAVEYVSDSPVFAKHREQKSRKADCAHQHHPPDFPVRFHSLPSMMSEMGMLRQLPA